MRFAHTNIVTTNWKALAEFYVKTFQCKIVGTKREYSGEWLDNGIGLKHAKMSGVHLLLPGHTVNGPTLEIYQYDPVDEQKHVLPNKRGFGHIAFEVDNVEKVFKTLKANGGTACGKITTHKVDGIGIITFIYARDPDGNIIELQSWKQHS